MKQILLFLICISISTAKSQVYFMKDIGDINSHDDFKCMHTTYEKGFIISATSTCSPSTYCTSITKLDSLGNSVWEKKISSGQNIWVEQTKDSCFVLLGWVSLSNLNNGTSLVKISKNGDLLWNKYYASTEHNQPYCIKQTIDNGYVILGVTGSGSDQDLFLTKIDSMGNTIWSKNYGTGNRDGISISASILIQTYDEGFAMLGSTHDSLDMLQRIYLIKTNSNGDTLWTKTYRDSNLSKHLEGHSLSQTKDSSYVIAGKTSLYPASNPIYFKVDKEGNPIWGKKILNTIGAAYSILESNNKDLILGIGTGESNLLRATEIGNFKWSMKYSLLGRTTLIEPTLDGGYVLGGATYNGNYGIGLIKTDSLGVNSCNSIPSSISIDSFLIIDYHKTTFQTNLNLQIVLGTVNNDSISLVRDLCNSNKLNDYEANNIVSIQPNPCSSQLIITSSLNYSNVRIINTIGQLVLSEGNNNNININHLDKGIYFLQLLDKDNNIIKTKRFIKESL